MADDSTTDEPAACPACSVDAYVSAGCPLCGGTGRVAGRPRKIHYAGALTSRGVLAGWAACSTGARAMRVRLAGAHTYDRAAVTCERCRYLLAVEPRP